MSHDSPKAQLSSISSKSLAPCIRDLECSNIFGGRKSSFQCLNIYKESDHLPPRDVSNSFDFLISNINGNKAQKPIKNILQLYNLDEEKVKIEESGFNPIFMEEVHSESEEVIIIKEQPPSSSQIIKEQPSSRKQTEQANDYLPEPLLKLLRNRKIRYQYVRSLMLIKAQKEVKSTRRLKVERYLEKRRKKTWDRKICYNCRQKVAEERLRIKGKFIKKRRAMEILGVTTPIEMVKLKERLQVLLKNKSNEEIDQIIQNEDFK